MEPNYIPMYPQFRYQINYKNVLEEENHKVLSSHLLSFNYYFIVLNTSRDLEKYVLFFLENVVYETTGEMENCVLKSESLSL